MKKDLSEAISPKATKIVLHLTSVFSGLTSVYRVWECPRINSGENGRSFNVVCSHSRFLLVRPPWFPVDNRGLGYSALAQI